MRIAGFQKSSFVDYPGIISAVVFTPGCNMRCGYCHNKHILGSDAPKVEPIEVMAYLTKRKGMIKGVVVTGGEPTLQPYLFEFISAIKNLGYKVKLDTNGTSPQKLNELIAVGLIDYVAMDLKAPVGKYSAVAGCEVDVEAVKKSVDIIKSSGINHEFRTTFCPMLTKEDILEISLAMAGQSDYYLQQYRQVEGEGEPHPVKYLEETAEYLKANGGKCVLRGL